MFGYNASKRASDMMGSYSVSPDSVITDWEDFKAWMIDAFKYLHQSSEIEKLASIDAAYGRREEWLKEEAVRRAEKEARLAEKQRAIDEREALLIRSTQEAMEQAVLQREGVLRAEAAKLEFLRVQAELIQVEEEREEAERAEATRLDVRC